MKKLVGMLHLWLGLVSGLVVFIISVTGCIYVFQEELARWLYTDRQKVEVPSGAARKPVSVLLQAAQTVVGEKHPIQSIEVPRDSSRSYIF